MKELKNMMIGNLVEMKKEWIDDAMAMVLLHKKSCMEQYKKTPKNYKVYVDTIPYYERSHTETDKAIMVRMSNFYYYPEHDEFYHPIHENGDHCHTSITFWCPKKFAWEPFDTDSKNKNMRVIPYWFIEKKIQEVIEKKTLDLTK